MRSSFNPEEVTQIEDKAYEVGVRIGRSEEQSRILDILSAQACNCTTYCDKIDMSFSTLIALIRGENK